MTSIAVLISGGGTTLKNLLAFRERGELHADIKLVISSNRKAKGIAFANAASIPCQVVEQKSFSDIDSFSHTIFDACRAVNVDWVVMGGFLKRVRIPVDFALRVINIHPSLIPAFSGQGFYGHHVHQSVIEYGCKVSGCTVHFVDDEYDHGAIIAQQSVPVLPSDTADDLAARVFAQECQLLPQVINLLAEKNLRVEGRTVWM
jgi:phosphoribosylglycinamide formyltransferase 1